MKIYKIYKSSTIPEIPIICLSSLSSEIKEISKSPIISKSSLLPTISPEQNDIIKQIELNNNVVIDSVAGSGKTTCNLHIAKHFSNLNILLLTYNAKLKLETREKVQALNIDNIEVHSYHSFCVKYYNNLCCTINSTSKLVLYDILKLQFSSRCQVLVGNRNCNCNCKRDWRAIKKSWQCL